jgi:hypothetical protein
LGYGGSGGEMAQTMYAHMNKLIRKTSYSIVTEGNNTQQFKE